MKGPGCPEKGSETKTVKHPQGRGRLLTSGCCGLLVFVPISGSHYQVGNELETGLQSNDWFLRGKQYATRLDHAS